MLLLSVMVVGVMVVDAVRELVFRVCDVVDVVMSVFIVDRDFLAWPFHGAVEMGETVSVSGQSALNGGEGEHGGN